MYQNIFLAQVFHIPEIVTIITKVECNLMCDRYNKEWYAFYLPSPANQIANNQ